MEAMAYVRVRAVGSHLHRGIVTSVTLDEELCGNVLFLNSPLLVTNLEGTGFEVVPCCCCCCQLSTCNGARPPTESFSTSELSEGRSCRPRRVAVSFCWARALCYPEAVLSREKTTSYTCAFTALTSICCLVYLLCF